MTPHDEHNLYLTNRAAWAKHVAPNWARMLVQADKPEKERLWRIAGPELKAAIRALKSESELIRGEPGTFTGKPEKPWPSGQGGIGRHAQRAM